MKILILAAFMFLPIISYAGKNTNIERKPNSVTKLECGGTEPFWGVTVNGKNVVFKDPFTNKIKKYLTNGIKEANGMSSGHALTIYDTNKNFVMTALSAEIAGSKCSDGMSDQEYNFHAIIVNGNRTFYGCCN